MGHEFESCATLNILKVKALKRWSLISAGRNQRSLDHLVEIWDQGSSWALWELTHYSSGCNRLLRDGYKSRMSSPPAQDSLTLDPI